MSVELKGDMGVDMFLNPVPCCCFLYKGKDFSPRPPNPPHQNNVGK
jgi:hypothetical protein